MTVQQVNVRFATTYQGRGTKQFQRDLNTLGGDMKKVGGQAAQEFGRFARFSQAAGTALLVGVGAALAVGIKAAIDFEEAFAGVRKTVDASEATFTRLAKEIRGLALEIPVAATELAKIGELGGQLGVPADALTDFIEIIAKLGVTTNLEVDEAATAVARFTEVMGSSDDEFENVASSLVELGNNFATTESEILGFATRLAGIGATVGLTEGEVLGLATAFTAMGEPAERGATAVQRAFVSMFQAVSQGGDDLRSFAEIVGVTSEQFVTLFKEDPAEAFLLFAEGLARIVDEGGDVTTLLQDLGLGSQRTLGAMLKAASGVDLLADAIGTGNDAFDENIALNEEAEKRFGTMASQIGILKNQFTELRLEIGDRAAPAFKDLLGFMSGFFQVVGDNFGILEKLFGLIVLLAGARGLLAVSRGLHGAITALTDTSIATGEVVKVGSRAKIMFARLGHGVRVFGGVLGLAAIALGLLAVAMGRNRQHAIEYQAAVEGVVDALEAMEEGTGNAREVYEAFTDLLTQKTGIFDLTLDLEEYREFVTGFGVTTRELIDLAVNDFEEFERVTSGIIARIEAQGPQLADISTVEGQEQRQRLTQDEIAQIDRRNESLAKWNIIIKEVTAATAALRAEEELRRKEQELEGRARATAPGGPGAIGVGGPGDTFMEGVSSVISDIAAGILTSREEYDEALAGIGEDTREFAAEFADEWQEIVDDFNDRLFDWSTAWDGYENAARLSTAELTTSIANWVEDQRRLTDTLAFVYENFGQDVGMFFQTLPEELQRGLAATLEEAGPEEFRAQMDVLTQAWGTLLGFSLENALTMAPAGAQRGLEAWEDFFTNEVAPSLVGHAEVGSDAWIEAVLEKFGEFRAQLSSKSPELAAAFNELLETGMINPITQLDEALGDAFDLQAFVSDMTTGEKAEFFHSIGLSWKEAVALAFAGLVDDLGNTATRAANRVDRNFRNGIRAESPSKLFMEYGKFSAQGFEIGFLKNLDSMNFRPSQPVFQIQAPAQTPTNGPSITIVNPQHKDDDVLDGIKRASSLVGLTRAAETTPGFN